MIDITAVTSSVILAALIGAIVWDLITWYYGLPTSSSHALIGGYAGAGVAKAGTRRVIPAGWTKTLIFIVLAPLIGFVLGFGFMVGDLLAVPRLRAVARRSLVPASCSWCRRPLYSLGHGANDAQKTMGIIAGALFAGGYITRVLHSVLGGADRAYTAIALGTLSGGWRIIHTMGSKITRLQPVGGFAAETAGAVSLFTATALGVPVSTTHTITGRDRRRRRDAAAVRGAVGRSPARSCGRGC